MVLSIRWGYKQDQGFLTSHAEINSLTKINHRVLTCSSISGAKKPGLPLKSDSMLPLSVPMLPLGTEGGVAEGAACWACRKAQEPKSQIFTETSLDVSATRMFSGFRSRWQMLRLCMCARPSQISRRMQLQ